MKNNFTIDLEKIRESAKKHASEVTTSNVPHEKVNTLIELLNHSLATELLCVARYKSHYYKAMSLGEQVLANEFLEHASEEQKHVDMLASRIDQLGGEPDFNPENITQRSHSQYVECEDAASMIRENLVAEYIAVSVYKQIIDNATQEDPTTRRVLEKILAVEEEHTDDLAALSNKFNSNKNTKYEIERLKKHGQDLGQEMVASEEGMTKPREDNPGDELARTINKLNSLDNEYHYSSKDFVEKA